MTTTQQPQPSRPARSFANGNGGSPDTQTGEWVGQRPHWWTMA